MKLLGIVLLLFSAVASAYAISRDGETRLSVISALSEFFGYAGEAIERYAMPQSEILRTAGNDLLLRCGYSDEQPPEGFESFVLGCEIADKSAKAEVLELCRGFGSAGRAGSAAACRRISEQLRGRAEEIRSKINAERRTVFALCLGASAVAVILLM